MDELNAVSGGCRGCGVTLMVIGNCENCCNRVNCLLAETPLCVPWFCNECWHEGISYTRDWRP